MKKHKDDLTTVEVVWETNYMDMTISKRGITLEPHMPNLTKHMSCTFTLHMYRVKQLSWRWLVNCGRKLDQKNGNVKTICHLFSRCRHRTWTVGNTDLQNDDHYILCIVVWTCNACSPPPSPTSGEVRGDVR